MKKLSLIKDCVSSLIEDYMKKKVKYWSEAQVHKGENPSDIPVVCWNDGKEVHHAFRSRRYLTIKAAEKRKFTYKIDKMSGGNITIESNFDMNKPYGRNFLTLTKRRNTMCHFTDEKHFMEPKKSQPKQEAQTMFFHGVDVAVQPAASPAYKPRELSAASFWHGEPSPAPITTIEQPKAVEAKLKINIHV